jgi:hypothetical protein
MRLTVATIVVGALVVLHDGSVLADPATDPKIEKADQLFVEGKALLASNLLQACDKFDQSLSYNPAAIGTLLNVALCDEKLGRVASAFAKFSEARDRATEQGLPQHVRAAEDHIAVLAPSIPHLAIKLTESLPGTQVVIDARVVAVDGLADIAVDPGERVIVVTAPKRLPFRTHLGINKFEHRDVVIPPLAASFIVRSSQRRIGQITTVAGGAAIAAGIGIGVYSYSFYRSQFGHKEPGDGLCNDMNICEAAGQAGTARARTLGNVGTVVGLVGVATLSVGAFLWYRSAGVTNDTGNQQLTIMPQIGPEGLSIAAIGWF